MKAAPRARTSGLQAVLSLVLLSVCAPPAISQPAAGPVPAAETPGLTDREGPNHVTSEGPPLSALPMGGATNDLCAGALRIPSCGPFPFETAVVLFGATATGDPKPTCGTGVGGGLWYVFTPGSSAEYTISSCGDLAPEDCPGSVVAVFRSTDAVCPQRTQLACNKQDPTSVTVSLTAETTYFIVVYGINPTPTSVARLSISRIPDSLLPNGGFESGDLTGWQFDHADVALVPKDPPSACFQPEMPSEGCYMACLSTDRFFGGSANGIESDEEGGVRSDLTSEEIHFDARPARIEVSFFVDFQTKESERSIAHDDAFQARLVTNAGTFLIIQIDSFGRTPDGAGLTVRCPTRQLPDRLCPTPLFQPTLSACPLDPGRRTGRMKVTWRKTFDTATRNGIGTGPVFVEFSVSNQGDTGNTSTACVDDVRVKNLKAQ